MMGVKFTEKRENLFMWDWVILVGIMLILSSFYLYDDIVKTTAGGLNVWYSLGDGKLNTFYNYKYPGVPNSSIPDGVVGGAYDFLIYLIFAVYDFPLWIWEKLTGLSFLSSWLSRIYIKGIIWVFVAIAGYWIYKIALLCDVDRKGARWSVFLFLSSGMFFYSVVVTGGYDIISVAFTLAGIYGYLKKNTRCFLLCFAVAIATKLFALWIFIPLLLLQEKRIRYMILDSLLAVSLILLPKLYFVLFGISSSDSAGIAMRGAGQSENVVNNVIAHSNLVNAYLFPQGGFRSALIKLDDMPLVFLCMFIIWLICFRLHRALTNRQIVYLCTIVMSVFFITATVHPHWIILLLPYLALLMVFQQHCFSFNVLLETLMSVGYVVRMNIFWPACGSIYLIYNMLNTKSMIEYPWPESSPFTKENLGIERILCAISVVTGISEEHISSLFGALFLAALCVFLYLNYPRKNINKVNFPQQIMTGTVYYIRLAVSFMIGLIPFVGYIIWRLYPYLV